MNNSSGKSNKPLHFLVGGVHFGKQNVGDEAILEGVVSILKKVQPNCEITVLTDQPYCTAKQLRVKAFKYQFIIPRSGRINRLFRILSRIIENLLQAYLALRSDIIVCAGATALSDSPAAMLRLASLAVFANKQLVCFPGGMNPGNSPDTLNKLLEISKEFNLFLVRDIDTKKRLVDAGFDPNCIQVTVDPVFNIKLPENLEDCVDELPWFNKNMNLVGIGISNEPDCSNYNNVSEWARIADFIVRTFNANVVFLPNNTQEGKDFAIMKAIHRAMECKDEAYVIKVELSPKGMVLAISKLQMMISSRMHQLFFSTLADTPFIGISRCAKIDSFLSFFGMEAASSVKNCRLEAIQSALETTWQHRKQFRKIIRERKLEMFDRSRQTEQLVKQFLDNSNSTPNRHRGCLTRIRHFSQAFFIKL